MADDPEVIDHAIDLLLERVAGMPEEKRREAFAHFVSLIDDDGEAARVAKRLAAEMRQQK